MIERRINGTILWQHKTMVRSPSFSCEVKTWCFHFVSIPTFVPPFAGSEELQRWEEQVGVGIFSSPRTSTALLSCTSMKSPETDYC